MSTLVSTGQITIIDNNDGTSVYTSTIYTQSVTQPTTPSGGSYNFATNTLVTPNTGGVTWSRDLPTVTNTPIWVSSYTFSTIDRNVAVSAGSWSVPTIFVVLPLGNVTRYIFSSATTAPALPANNATTGWDTIATSTTIWMSYQINNIDKDNNVTTYGAWQPAVKIKGEGGDPGTDGSKSITINAFKWSNSGVGTYAQAFTYTWSNGGVDFYPSGWAASAPASPGTGYTLHMISLIISAAATATTTSANWSNAVPNIIGYRQDGSIGQTGQAQVKSFVFLRSATAPSAPSAASGSFASPVPAGWNDGIPAGTNPLYVSTRIFTSDGLAPQQAAWSTPVIFTQNGTNGLNANGGSVRYIFSSSTTAPAIPATNSTFGWDTTPSVNTIWMCQQVNTVDPTGTVVTYGSWGTAIKIKGENGNPGGTGATGTSYRIAYIVTNSSSAPTTIFPGVGDVPPTSAEGAWSFTATSNLSAGQYMYQSDGLYTAGGNIAWGNAYLSNLKVGSLSAISANLGTVSISTVGSLSSTGKTYGSATAGIFLGYDSSNYKFDVGNSANYLRFNGTQLSATGMTIYDSSGNVAISASGNMDFSRINGSTKPENNATYGANGSNLSISTSGNMFPNSDFAGGIQNWYVSWSQYGGTNYTVAQDLAAPDWAPAGGHTLAVVRDGSTEAAAGWFDVTYNKYFPVAGSQYLEVSAYIASHRCARWLMVAYYDINQIYISEIGWQGNNTDNGGWHLSNWDRVGGFFTTPSNCRYIRIWYRLGVTTSSNPYGWITKIFFGIPKSGQTELSPWSAATSSGAFAELNQINSSNATTYIANAAIGNALIANAAIGTANIIDANITTLKVAGGAITAPETITGSNYYIPGILSGAGQSTVIYSNTISGGQLPVTVVDLEVKRIILISFSFANFDSDPGTALIYLVHNGVDTTDFRWFDVNYSLINGSANTYFNFTFVHTTPANSSNTYSYKIQLVNGDGTTSRWTNTYQPLISKPTITCFTGKR